MQAKAETWAERLVRKPVAPVDRPAANTAPAPAAGRGGPGVSRGDKKKNRKKRKYQPRLYERYLADSGSEADEAEDEEPDVETMEFTVGMDIRILIQQTLRNMARSVCLEDVASVGDFGDTELCCFAAALKYNSSILSLQIRHLPVTDASLVPLCRALERHPSLRALDISHTHASSQITGPALRHLVCTNSSILFVRTDDNIASAADASVIAKATRYNAMVCPDPTSNPFHLGLIQKISSLEEKQQQFTAELQARPWLVVNENADLQTSADPPGSSPQSHTKKDIQVQSRLAHRKAVKGHVSLLGKVSEIGAEICPQYMQGSCAYGSRCKYFHPEGGTAAIETRQTAQPSTETSMHNTDDARSTFTSTRHAQEHFRLQSRLRPPHFHLVRTITNIPAADEYIIKEDTGTTTPERHRATKKCTHRAATRLTVVAGFMLTLCYVYRWCTQ